MTLANILRQKLSEAPAAHERHDFTVADEASGWTLYLTAEHRDAWTTVAWEMSLRRAKSGGGMATWGERIARRSSGLLEPLTVVEVDAAQSRALVRSGPPTTCGDKVSYYELVLDGTSSALVRRYEGSHVAAKRTQVPFVLTNEVLVKLVDDVTAE